MRESICHLNGELLPLNQARVPVLDRGFLFGDGVYEVIPGYGRRPFELDSHLARLERSLAAIALANPLQPSQWAELVRQLLERNDPADQCIYIQVTRGVARRDHAFPAAVTPTVFAYSFPFPHLTQAQREGGLEAITWPDNRWLRGDIKSISLLGSVLARQASVEQGAHETILIRDGWVSEASASNVWLVRGRVLLCPPMDRLKLEGVRVPLLQRLAAASGFALQIRPLAEWELRCADEILLSSATKEVAAVTRLDGRSVGSGAPGPVCAALYQAYQGRKREQCGV